MRVLFVTNFVPHYRLGVLEALADRHELSVLADDRDHLQGVPSDEGSLHVRRTRAWRLVGPVVLMPLAPWRVLTGDHDLVLVYANVFWPHVWLCTIAARLRGRPVVHWGHGWSGTEGRVMGRLRTVLYRMADRLLVFGEASARVGVERHRFPADRVTVVGNSLPGLEDASRIAPRPTGDERDRILLVARLIPERRTSLLVEAVAHLRERGRPIGCTVVGDGPDLASARALAAELGVGDLIEFVGACYDRDELRRHHERASLMVVPGKAGLTVAQAFAWGCPVVCSDDDDEHAPEAEAVRHGVTGWRFLAGDADSLADAIEGGLRPDRWEHVAAAAFRVYEEQFSPASHAARMSRSLEGVCGHAHL